MHLAFTRLFANENPESLGHVDLADNNGFGLPAGEYLIHDLFPLTSEVASQLYFTVEHVASGDILLTARMTMEPQHLSISPEHLQSVQATEAMEMLRQVLMQPDVQSNLSARLQRVWQLHMAVALDRAGPDRAQLREAMIDELALQFPGTERSQLASMLTAVEDQLTQPELNQTATTTPAQDSPEEAPKRPKSKSSTKSKSSKSSKKS